MGEQPQDRPTRRVVDPEVEVEPTTGATERQSVEVPVEDAAEQARPAEDADEEREVVRHVPLDVDPADLVEQGREVDYDEDEYR